MIKKVLHIVFAILLLVSTVGLMVSKHYCRGQLVSVSMFHKAASCCDNGGCCNNENHFYQVKDDFSTPAVFSVPLSAEIHLLSQQLWQAASLFPSEQEEENTFADHSPPPLTVMERLAEQQVYRL
ncbi:hypothetical protein [Maribellus sp. YY47]|uniref:HYC_CC_PP family protein n=1 Tax=Maribellus sp. YY47 TaxID=2929486 RepID=UPI0020010D19|nr:hypothetical protein [Maribellus sp. YY47]MCK3683779.1 hypothetical protein [Maribellus sp. YY47]